MNQLIYKIFSILSTLLKLRMWNIFITMTKPYMHLLHSYLRFVISCHKLCASLENFSNITFGFLFNIYFCSIDVFVCLMVLMCTADWRSHSIAVRFSIFGVVFANRPFPALRTRRVANDVKNSASGTCVIAILRILKTVWYVAYGTQYASMDTNLKNTRYLTTNRLQHLIYYLPR